MFYFYSKRADVYSVNIQNLNQQDNRKWDTGGSRVLTMALREICNISMNDNEQITG